MATLELISKVKELKSLKLMAEELQAEITALEDVIKAEMTANHTDTLIAGNHKVKFTTVTNRRFDTKAFQATYATLYNQFIKVTEGKRFSIA